MVSHEYPTAEDNSSDEYRPVREKRVCYFNSIH